MNNRLRSFHYYITYHTVVLPHGEQRGILKAENKENEFNIILILIYRVVFEKINTKEYRY